MNVQAGRRAFITRSAAFGALSLGGCATPPSALPAGFAAAPRLAPIVARPDRIMNTTVCLRPFRAQGPRLDTETVGGKLVVHNYGHGGSGWSLSWGSGLIAVTKALAGGEKDIAVIGCGALGLTAAVLAQRAGARVTIYAKDWLPDTRSARATGVWSPDSRIALEKSAAPGFPALWEQMTRSSFRMHQQYLGLADAPVAWIDRYNVFDTAPGPVNDPIGFAFYGGRVRDLIGPSQPVEAGAHPFGTRTVRKMTLPLFNITEYGRMLTSDFLAAGGKIETREFRSPSELSSLKQKVVINCTGYGARELWKDESLIPVRGQITWLVPQPEVTYGVNYRNVGALSRRDGLVIQSYGPDEGWGYNDDNETASRSESESAIAALAGLFPQSAAGPR